MNADAIASRAIARAGRAFGRYCRGVRLSRKAEKCAVVVTMTGGETAEGVTLYWHLTRPLIEAYCKRHGYLFVVNDRNELPIGEHAAWNKLRSWNVVPPNIDHLFVWDADLVPLPHTPAIHSSLAGVDIGMAEFPLSHRCRGSYRYWYGREAASRTIFNSGLVSCPRSLAWVFDEAWRAGADRDFAPKMWDQSGLNFAIFQYGLPVEQIDSKWNRWICRGFSIDDARGAWCLHFAARRWPRWRNIQRLVYRFGLTPELIATGGPWPQD